MTNFTLKFFEVFEAIVNFFTYDNIFQENIRREGWGILRYLEKHNVGFGRCQGPKRSRENACILVLNKLRINIHCVCHIREYVEIESHISLKACLRVLSSAKG